MSAESEEQVKTVAVVELRVTMCPQCKWPGVQQARVSQAHRPEGMGSHRSPAPSCSPLSSPGGYQLFRAPFLTGKPGTCPPSVYGLWKPAPSHRQYDNRSSVCLRTPDRKLCEGRDVSL